MPFVDEARTQFAFLVRDFQFLGPHVETGRAYMALDYTGRDLGVRVEFDVREESIDVLLVRLRDGAWPKRDEGVWVHLDRIARARGALAEGGVFRLPQSDAELNRRIAEEARILRQAAADIIEGRAEKLDQFVSRAQVFPES